MGNVFENYILGRILYLAFKLKKYVSFIIIKNQLNSMVVQNLQLTEIQ